MPRRLLLLVSLAVALAVATTGATLLTGATDPVALSKEPTPTITRGPVAQATIVGARGRKVPWNKPLALAVTHGRIVSVTALGPDGLELAGTLSPQSWTSVARTLIPGQPYQLRAVVKGDNGGTTAVEQLLSTSAPASVLSATVSPAGGVFGIGQPVIVRFDKKITGAAARSAVLSRLQVTTTPAVQGAWRWYNSYEVHYRGKAFWKPRTKVAVTAALAGLNLPGTQTWGNAKPAKGGFTVGRSMVSTVDVAAHTVTVRRDGKVIKVFPMSAGRPDFPTRGGVHVVLTREREHLFNSATIGIPTASPDGYYKKLPYSVRITNSGTFLHAQPGTVRYQGRRNVSHGCINLSTANAKWFYDNSLLGDVVQVVNAVVAPRRTDAGTADWNYSWPEWSKGNLDG